MFNYFDLMMIIENWDFKQKVANLYFFHNRAAKNTKKKVEEQTNKKN